MTLPDWSSAINTQINAFLSWGTVGTLIAVLVGISVGSLVLIQFLKIFHR